MFIRDCILGPRSASLGFRAWQFFGTWRLGFEIFLHHSFHKKLVRPGRGGRRTADRLVARSEARVRRGGLP